MTESLPRPFGRYTLLEVLGEGGMATVFKAKLDGPQGFAKLLAIKVVHRDVTDADEALRASLVTEARIGGLLQHPHIVDVYDFGEADGQHFVAMEWIDGADASALLHRGPLPPRLALDVALALADALQYLHTLAGDDGPLGLVHRDLKPSNVLLGRRGAIKLMDFGIARGEGMSDVRTATGLAKGSAPWMSPEQALAGPLDARSDLFALGAVLFELVAGRRFNDQPTITAVVAGLLGVEGRIGPGGELDGLDGVVPGLAEVVRRCLRRDPGDRYADAAALAAALRPLRDAAPDAGPLSAWVDTRLAGRDPSHSLDATEEVSSDLVAAISGGSPPSPPRVDRSPSDRSASPPPAQSPSSARRSPAGRVAAGSALLLLLLAAVLLRRGPDAPSTQAPPPLPRLTSTQLSASGWLEGEPALSPDGRRLVFVRIVDGVRTFVLSDLEGGTERALQPGDLEDLGQPTWSPDGTLLAFRAGRPKAGIYTFELDAPAARPVRLAEEGAHPAFSPDGTRVAYSTEPIGRPLGKRGRASIRIVDLATLGRVEIEAFDANQPKWSPDGRWLAFWGIDASAGRDVWTTELATGRTTRVTHAPGVDWNPVWAADGEHLYFLSDRDGGFGLHRVGVDATTGAATGRPESLGSALHASPGQLDADPQGRWIAFDTSVYTENVQVLRLDDAGRPTAPASWLTRGSRNVAWSQPSPDGGSVAWVEQDRGIEDVFVGPADGSTRRQLTDDEARDRMPRWLADDRIAFYSNRDDSWGLWQVGLETGDLTRLDAGGGGSTFAVAPGGRRLATAVPNKPEIAIVELDEAGREVSRRRALFDHPDPIVPRPASWSPDGERLLVGGASPSGTDRWAGAWSVQTGEVLAGPANVVTYEWVTDEVVLGARAHQVLRWRWPDGEMEVIHSLADDTMVGWLGLSEDRRTLTVHEGREVTGIWRWELNPPAGGP